MIRRSSLPFDLQSLVIKMEWMPLVAWGLFWLGVLWSFCLLVWANSSLTITQLNHPYPSLHLCFVFKTSLTPWRACLWKGQCQQLFLGKCLPLMLCANDCKEYLLPLWSVCWLNREQNFSGVRTVYWSKEKSSLGRACSNTGWWQTVQDNSTFIALTIQANVSHFPWLPGTRPLISCWHLQVTESVNAMFDDINVFVPTGLNLH